MDPSELYSIQLDPNTPENQKQKKQHTQLQ